MKWRWMIAKYIANAMQQRSLFNTGDIIPQIAFRCIRTKKEKNSGRDGSLTFWEKLKYEIEKSETGEYNAQVNEWRDQQHGV